MDSRQWWQRYYVVLGFPVMQQPLRFVEGPMPVRAVSRPLRILWWCGVVRVYEDGDVWSVVARYWHPVTWLLLLAVPSDLLIPA